jgi:hypothetical protein
MPAMLLGCGNARWLGDLSSHDRANAVCLRLKRGTWPTIVYGGLSIWRTLIAVFHLPRRSFSVSVASTSGEGIVASHCEVTPATRERLLGLR